VIELRQRRKIKPEPALVPCEVREWLALREFPDYEISNDGRLRRRTAGSNTKAGALIRVGMSDGGYPKYGLTSPNGRRVSRSAHTLVADEFLPAALAGQSKVLHADDDKLNCRVSNLRRGTSSDNAKDAIRNGGMKIGAEHPAALKPWTRPRGEKHRSVKLTDEKVLAILSDVRQGTIIARQYGVDSALIYRIKKGEVWKHITNRRYQEMLEAGEQNDS
jgi:hypothetical protein